MQAARVQAAAARAGAAGRPGWTGWLGTALCWGGPALGLVILGALALGGGGLLVGAAAGVVPVLAMLACPLGMYLMMRSMSRRGPGDGGPRDTPDPR